MKAALVLAAGQTPIYGDFAEPRPAANETLIADSDDPDHVFRHDPDHLFQDDADHMFRHDGDHLFRHDADQG